MAEHTQASTAGSAHARYVAYREDGYSPEDARRMSRPVNADHEWHEGKAAHVRDEAARKSSPFLARLASAHQRAADGEFDTE